jgi:peroxiredoxin
MSTYSTCDLNALPPDLPEPADDGLAAHLSGAVLPSVPLHATDGSLVDLSSLPGWTVVYIYPRNGQPGAPPLVDDWDLIPGARGCTPHTCSYRDHFAELQSLNTRVYGLSTQTTEYQREMVDRLHLPFPILSDHAFALTAALLLPTFDVAGLTLLKRLSLIIHNGAVVKVNYPVFPPNEDAARVVGWLRAQRTE